MKLDFDENKIQITDNCGRIPFEIAKQYAFRFGRPKDMPDTEHSVGQFGVGLKRSLFKLGKHFRIESKTPETRFIVEHDVDDWVKSDKWEFEFASIVNHRKKKNLSECGTQITVTRLNESVVSEFGSNIFESQLKKALEAAHQQSLEKGFSISINDIPLEASVAELRQSTSLKPAYRDIKYEEDSDAPVSVKLYTGIADSDPQKAGWDIFCNGRMTVEAEGTLVTGWGEGNGKTIPRFHNQFARFRGFAFFDCDDASKLPWNTTKTGVDSDSRIYQAVRQQMIDMMRPVIDFLNRLDAEKDVEEKDRFLTDVVSKTKQLKLPLITESPIFLAPEVKLKKEKRDRRRNA